MEKYECDACGKLVPEEKVKWFDYGHYCQDCYDSLTGEPDEDEGNQ